MTRIIHIILLAWLQLIVHAQPAIVRQLGMSDGLSSDYVLSMAQDKYGFLWVATENGLNRFDGSHFLSYYKMSNVRGLTGNELNCLLDDPAEPLMWIATQRGGLNVYDYGKDEFRRYLHDKTSGSIATNDITSVAPSEDSSIWVSTYWKGIDYLDKRQRKFIHYNTGNVKGLVSNQTWTVLDGGNGIIYVGHVRDGFSIIDTHARRALNFRHNAHEPQSLSGNAVYCIYRDKDSRVWVGTNNGLDLFDPIRAAFIHYDDNGRFRHPVYSIRQFSDGRLWIASEQGGIAIISIPQLLLGTLGVHSFAYIREGDTNCDLSGNSVRCLMEDRFGNVWVGLYGAGINLIEHSPPLFSQLIYSPVAPERHLSNKSVLGLCTDRQRRLWVGTDGDGLNLFDHHLKRIDTTPILPGRSIQVIHSDCRGGMWLGCFNDNLYYLASPEACPRPVFRSAEDVRCLYEANGSTLFVGTSTGINEIDTRSLGVRRRIAIKENLTRCLTRDHEGRYWVGTFGGGLIICDQHFKVSCQVTTANGLPSNTVCSVLADRKGRVWVATGEGLVRFDQPSNHHFTVYSTAQGLNNFNIRALAEDAQGNIWLSTDRGISCKRASSETILNYDYRDRISIGSFNANSVAAGADSTLYFGCTHGITWFKPAYVLAKREPPRVFITSVDINTSREGLPDSTKVLMGCKSISLSHKENTFTLHFNVLNYSLSHSVEYAYRMEGLQDEWITTQDNQITLRNIPHGTYRLEVRCRLRNQEWSSHVASILIKIRPPIWLAWWAWVIYLLTGACIIFYVLKFYLRKIRLEYLLRHETAMREHEKHLNEERLRFFTNITHELRTPLTLILGPLEDMSHSSDIPIAEKHRLAVINQSANRLHDLINRLLEFRKTETDNRHLNVRKANIVDAVHEVCLTYEELSHNDNVAIRFIAPEPSIELWFDPEVIRIVVDNLVSNAIKYTDRGHIDISVERKGDAKQFVEIAVSDTGYGISADALPHIFDRYYQENTLHQASGTGIGLALVKNLVTLHEGTIRVESTPGQGSSFIVTLDVANTYPQANRGQNLQSPQLDDGNKPAADFHPDTSVTGRDILLIVEDNKDIRQYIAESFADSYDVRQAEDGRQGLAIALDTIPDIIISDIMMPHMDGNELCKILKRDLRTSHIPIILLTAKESNTEKEEGYDAGADSYITKPFSRSLLKSRIENLIKARRLLLKRMQTVVSENYSMEQKQRLLREAMTQTDKAFFDRLHKIIDDNISGELDINLLASQLNISTSTLYRKMRALTGNNTNEYIRHYKMQYAEKLLLQNRYTISEIAFMVGISSIAYFRKCFKEEYGSIPSEYIKKIKAAE